MRTIRIEKVILNVGTGKEQAKLERGEALLAMLSSTKPIKTITQKRIPGWGLRPGLPVGVKVTIRGKEAHEIVARLLDAREYTLPTNAFDDNGNISFGISEYIDIKGATYDPKIGMMGLQASVTLERPGFSVKRRKNAPAKVGHKHHISQQDAIVFFKENFNIKISEEEEDDNE